MPPAKDSQTPLRPTLEVTQQAQRAIQTLAGSSIRSLEVRTQEGRVAHVPLIAVRILLTVLDELSHGNAVSVVASQAELTTQQAADLLNVSRPYLIQLLETQQLPFRLVGRHRRVLASDVLEYKQKERARQRKVMAELTALGEGLDDGEDE